MKYKIIIEYDGSYFHGWQIQKNLKTVQSTLSGAIFELTKEHSLVEGAGRTDALVHATGQCGHFSLQKPWIPFKLQAGLNHFLMDKGISILSVDFAKDDFHARFDATSRTYRYIMLNRFAMPVIDKNRVWHVKERLDIDKMKKACKSFIGKHDFTSFRASSCQASSPIRTLSDFSITVDGRKIISVITAKSFLHNQVRIMIGTLKQIGDGTFKEDHIEYLLKNPNRVLGGITAPPTGLYLENVSYDSFKK